MKTPILKYDGKFYPIECENFYIKKTSDGNKLLSFDIPIAHIWYSLIQCERKIVYDDINYNIKSIQEMDDIATIQCELDLDVLKGNLFITRGFENDSLDDVIYTVIPLGSFNYETNGFDSGPFLTYETKGLTAFEIIMDARKRYNAVYKFVGNKIFAYTPSFLQTNFENKAYFVDGLNINRVDKKVDSFEFYTRLYPYGKDDIDISSVNGGIVYLNNNQYSSKTIMKYMEFTDVTNPTDLKAKATIELEKHSKPFEEFEIDIIDIAKLNADYYNFEIDILSVVTFLNSQAQTSTKYLVDEYVEYPNEPEKNKAKLVTIF